MTRSWRSSVGTTRIDLTDARSIGRSRSCLQSQLKEIAVKFTIQMLIEESDQLPLSIPIQTIERSCERIEDVGLHVAEAKGLLGTLQEHMVRSQLHQLLETRRPCGFCHHPRPCWPSFLRSTSSAGFGTRGRRSGRSNRLP